MRIWQVGASATPNRVDGLNMVVWSLGVEQARLGHDVTMILDDPPLPDAVALADELGLNLVYVPSTRWKFAVREANALIKCNRPDIAQVHDGFEPRMVALSMHLKLHDVPYMATPHGTIRMNNFTLREAPKGHLWVHAAEKPRMRMAHAISVLSRTEGREMRRIVGRGYRGILRQMPNPVDLSALDGAHWTEQTSPPRLLFLGRFAVDHKGIDILYEVARRMPDVQFDAYGNEDAASADWFREVEARKPENLTRHSPIFGAAKAKVMADATMYIQTSRWDALSISVIEAMYLGVPCAITETTDLAEYFVRHNLGLVMPLDPVEAAARLTDALAHPERLHEWSERGREYARKRFNPSDVAARYIQLYQDALAKR